MSEVRDYSWGTYAEQKSENECYENLSNAVIQQAVADMADAVMRKELAERQIAESNKIFCGVRQVFQQRQVPRHDNGKRRNRPGRGDQTRQVPCVETRPRMQPV